MFYVGRRSLCASEKTRTPGIVATHMRFPNTSAFSWSLQDPGEMVNHPAITVTKATTLLRHPNFLIIPMGDFFDPIRNKDVVHNIQSAALIAGNVFPLKSSNDPVRPAG